MFLSDSNVFSFLLLVITIGVSCLAFLKWYDYAFFKKRSLTDVDRMSGLTFEKYLSVLFREQGYQVIVTPDASDFGADLIIEKDGIKTAVQAKRYKQAVGIAAVQEVVAAKFHYQCQRAMVVTNSTFTSAAWKLAMSTHVWLIDRKRLETMVAEMRVRKKVIRTYLKEIPKEID